MLPATAIGTRPTISVMVSGLNRMVGADPRFVVEAARAAERAGVDELVVGDHVVMGNRPERYPYGQFAYGADDPIGPDEPWPEILTLLGALAVATERIRLGTGVLLAPLRPAVLLAKTAATVDALSGGRLSLGVGVGWQREEYDALGVPFGERWQRLDDTMRACRALWSAGPATFTSATISFADIWCSPRPVQARLPVWFGGRVDATRAAWVADWGDGWFPLGVGLDDVAAGVGLLRTAFGSAGRDPDELWVRAWAESVLRSDGTVDGPATAAAAEPLLGVGVTDLWFVVSPALGYTSMGEISRFLDGVGSLATGAPVG